MALIVQKFGGTSVGDIDRIDGVAARVAATVAEGHQVVVVVSAIAGETDRLLNLAWSVSTHGRPNPRELDVLLSTGETVTTALLAMNLEKLGVTACSFNGLQAGIRTDARHSRARIESIDTTRLQAELARGRVPVVAGFQGITADGAITTLGRGGSDTTAVALAAALSADECRIYTDVDGVYTADPRVVPEARRLDNINVELMLELAAQGSKILQVNSVEFCRRHKVPLRVLSTFEPGPGTLVTVEGSPGDQEPQGITGIACRKSLAYLQVQGISPDAGVRDSLLESLAAADIDPELLVQNVAKNTQIDFTITVDRQDYDIARERITQVLADLAVSIDSNVRVAKVSLVGVGVNSHASIASLVRDALLAADIRVYLTAAAQARFSVVVDEDRADDAVRALHNEFQLHHSTNG